VRLEFEVVVVVDDRHLRFVFARFEDAADARDGDAGYGARNSCRGCGGEEELVVFAAVKKRGDLGAVVECGGEGVEGECGEVELGGDVGGGAEVSEVGGQAVAEVDAGGGKATAQEGLADGQAGLREEVRVVGCGICAGRRRGR